MAVVLPTMTWQAYNLRDENGDGIGDTWYADWRIHTARLGRPFLNRGVPFNFRTYDLPFLHWLAWYGHGADFLSDSDLYSTSGGRLARAYRLIVFPGHHEYVTTHEYDVVQRYRDLGGNLAFLSANNFYRRIVRSGQVMTRTEQWRELGRPEAALIGAQYIADHSGGVQAVDRAPRRGCALAVRRDGAPRRLDARRGRTSSRRGAPSRRTATAQPRCVARSTARKPPSRRRVLVADERRLRPSKIAPLLGARTTRPLRTRRR